MTSPISEQLRSRYDSTPYESVSIPQSHPDNLRTIAALAGFSTPDVTHCRVLELGCAAGGNLAPMAQTLPGSAFLGIDLSSRQIDVGQEVIKSAGLKNIELRCQDLMDFSDKEPFDYIIAHGVYSWVPQDVREKVMQICARNLASNGVAYLSYNALPGWHLNRITRDLMLYHCRNAADDKSRASLARGVLGLIKSAPPIFPGYRAAISE